MVLAILGLLFLLAAPSLVGSRARAQVVSARRAFRASHALARQIAPQYGRLSKLHIDPRANSFWVTVDTSSVLWGPEMEDTIREVVYVGDRFGGVSIYSNKSLLCFDPRGIGTAARDCQLPNTTVVFSLGGYSDSVTISRLGRLLER